MACGCPCTGSLSSVSSPPIAVQLGSSRSVSRPGRTTAPLGRRAMALRRAAVAGIEPVDPAAMTGPLGLLREEPPRFGMDQGAAAPGRVARPPLGQDLGPVLGGDADEVERQPEIFRVVGLDGLGELVPRNVLGREPVHETLEIAGEADRVRGRGGHEERRAVGELQARPIDRLGPELDEPGQDQPPLERGDRRGQRLGALEGGIVGGGAGELEFGIVRLAERHDARQQLRPAIALRRQQRREGARGAARRQVDRGLGEGGRVAAEPVEDAAARQRIRERRQERRAGRNREDAGVP